LTVIYGYSQITQLRTLAWCCLRNVPVLMVTDSNAVTRRTAFKRALRSALLRPLLSQIAGFLTVGDQNERALAEMSVPLEKMYRSPFTIDEGRYVLARHERASRRARVRGLHAIANDVYVGIAVGKLVSRKRTSDAVNAFANAAARSKRRQIHLLVCGNGPELSEIEALATAGAPVTLAGFINVDQLPDYFAAADVLVHPASQDPHPLICSEAACIGLPMILSDRVGTIGPTDISRRDENALIFSCGDVAALANHVLRLEADQQLVAGMSEASLRIFNECNLEASVEGFRRAVNAVARHTKPI
jgi:glycosyltransferase involved in cell wall biosynthesis